MPTTVAVAQVLPAALVVPPPNPSPNAGIQEGGPLEDRRWANPCFPVPCAEPMNSAQPQAAFRIALNVELGRMTALHFSASAL